MFFHIKPTDYIYIYIYIVILCTHNNSLDIRLFTSMHARSVPCKQVRQVIVDELTDNARQYATITEECGTGATDYLTESRMASEGVWGSDVEIIVAATLLRTPIAVYSAFGDRQYLWQVFEPVSPTTAQDDQSVASSSSAAESAPSHAYMIYLQNTNNHFEPVVDI